MIAAGILPVGENSVIKYELIGMNKMKSFEEVFEDKTKYGTKIKTNEYQQEGKYLIVDQGQEQVAGYTNLEEGVFEEVPAIVFGDHTRVIKYVEEPFFLGADGVKVLKCRLPNANYKYLYYTLLNAKIPNTGYNRHFKWLKEIKIAYPNTEKQTEIVCILDKVSKIIGFRQRQLKKLDELVKSRFIELFGEPDGNPMNWETAELERNLEIVGGFAFKSEGFTESGIPVLRIGNINSGHFLPVNMVFWPDDPSLARYKMYPGDLVMSLTGTVGKDDYGNVCVLSDEYPEYYLNQRNAKLAIGATLNRHYLSEMLKFSRIKKRLTGISRGVRQANISNRDILALRVPIPPIKLQEQFATFVEQTDKSELAIQQSLEKLETLKKALMQQYFG